MKTIIYFLSLVTALSRTQHYYYDGDDYNDYPGEEGFPDPCDAYESDHAFECHKDQFPSETLRQRFGDRIRECCHGHKFFFVDNCESNSQTFTRDACGDPNSLEVPVLPEHALSCPLNCFSTKLAEEQFSITKATGQLVVKSNMTLVQDYCLAYRCGGLHNGTRNWEVMARACLCFDEAAIREVDKTLPENVARCCPDTKLIPYQAFGLSELTCPISETRRLTEGNQELRTCSREWKPVDLSSSDLSRPDLVSLRTLYQGIEVKNQRRDQIQLCAGVSVNNPGEGIPALQSSLMYCHAKICGGNFPCFRTCCPPKTFFNRTSTICEPMSSDDLAKYMNHSLLVSSTEHALSAVHFEKEFHQTCFEKNEARRILRPSEGCRDEFSLSWNETSDSLTLKMSETGRETDLFCLQFENGATIAASVCYPMEETKQKFKFYPYVLLFNCILLFITLLVYKLVPKLLNNYTKLMNNFVLNLLLAFLILSINQFVPLAEKVSFAACVFSAFAQQYFFLTAFTFMTLMSVELSLLMKGSKGNNTRYSMQVFIGYMIPIGITVLTVLVEFSAPKCAAIRPRFGEEGCFFASLLSKFVFFLLPIVVMLLINLGAFIMVVHTMFSLDRQKRRLQIRQANNRNENMEKFLLYLKLFLGMGFLWTFEIIAHFNVGEEEHWYFVDVLNMCQGVYIFLIFVCKRNVYNSVFGTDAIHKSKVATRLRQIVASMRPGGSKHPPVPESSSAMDPSSAIQSGKTSEMDMPMSTLN